MIKDWLSIIDFIMGLALAMSLAIVLVVGMVAILEGCI